MSNAVSCYTNLAHCWVWWCRYLSLHNTEEVHCDKWCKDSQHSHLVRWTVWAYVSCETLSGNSGSCFRPQHQSVRYEQTIHCSHHHGLLGVHLVLSQTLSDFCYLQELLSHWWFLWNKAYDTSFYTMDTSLPCLRRSISSIAWLPYSLAIFSVLW